MKADLIVWSSLGYTAEPEKIANKKSCKSSFPTEDSSSHISLLSFDDISGQSLETNKLTLSP